MNSYHIKVDEDISEDIIDNGDQNVGSFDLECMSEPNGCCTKGKHLLSKTFRDFIYVISTP